MKTKILSILALAGLFSTSCTDLDEKLYSNVETDDYGKVMSELKPVVGGAYATLRGFNDSSSGGTICFPTCELVFFLEECVSDEACIPTRNGTDWYDGGRYQQLQAHTWDTRNTAIWSAWKYCFQGIANVNSCIHLVDVSGLTDTDKASLNAELRGLRAYYYSLLLDRFGSVPIVSNFENSELPKKSTRAEVFKFVEDELKAIMDQLPAVKRYGGFTQDVANSILARIYLNAEVYTGSARWQDCLDACAKVTGYTLEEDYFTSFATDNDKSNEIIFAIPYDHRQGTTGNYLASMTYHYLQNQAFTANSSYPWCGNGISAQPGLYSSFDENDIRRNSILMGPQISLATGNVILMDDGNPLIYTEEINSISFAIPNQGGRLHKYEARPTDQWERDNDWVLFRYAEIVMAEAEANFRMGNTAKALSLVNTIRNRAGLDNLTSLTLEDLDNEWKHEFVFEGLRRMTNIRFGTFFEPWWEKGTTPRYRSVYPIPQNVIDLNPNLEQNPDYM